MIPFAAMAAAMTMAPRVEIYTQLACAAHRPDYRSDNGTKAVMYKLGPDGDYPALLSSSFH